MTDKTLLILSGPSSGAQRDNPVDINEVCATLCNELGLGLEFREMDSTEQVMDVITKDSANFDALIVNPGTSSDIEAPPTESYRSAMKSIAKLDIPVVEVHAQNIFRGSIAGRPLHVPDGNVGFICGLGKTSYLLAIKAVARQLAE
jgi:3-dehydroquinate dehydratase-2